MGCENVLISIIVPVYNVKNYLDRCIESIVKQTYSNLDIILVDDGSEDGSGSICDQWGQNDNRIHVFHKSNGGLSSARNYGMRKARGELIGFVDSDDYIAEDMYEKLHCSMKDDVDITCCGRICVYPDRKIKAFCLNAPARFSSREAMEEVILLRRISSSVCTKLFRRNLFNGLSFPAGRVSEDVYMLYQLLKRSRDVVHIGEGKYFNYYRKDSISNKEFYMRRVDYVLFKRDICLDVKEVYPQLNMQAEAGYLKAVLSIMESVMNCSMRKKYDYIEKRLKKVLCHMAARAMRNDYIEKDIKRKILNYAILNNWRHFS